MKFTIGDHLQEIDSYANGIVIMVNKNSIPAPVNKVVIWYWYEIKNDELGLVNHWVPENKLELHKQTLREIKLKELGI